MDGTERTLKQVRMELRLSLEQVAVACLMSVSGITRWESGEGGTYLKSREGLRAYCLLLHNEAKRMGRTDLATKAHELCPDVFEPVPPLEVAA